MCQVTSCPEHSGLDVKKKRGRGVVKKFQVRILERNVLLTSVSIVCGEYKFAPLAYWEQSGSFPTGKNAFLLILTFLWDPFDIRETSDQLLVCVHLDTFLFPAGVQPNASYTLCSVNSRKHTELLMKRPEDHGLRIILLPPLPSLFSFHIQPWRTQYCVLVGLK